MLATKTTILKSERTTKALHKLLEDKRYSGYVRENSFQLKRNGFPVNFMIKGKLNHNAFRVSTLHSIGLEILWINLFFSVGLLILAIINRSFGFFVIALVVFGILSFSNQYLASKELSKFERELYNEKGLIEQKLEEKTYAG